MTAIDISVWRVCSPNRRPRNEFIIFSTFFHPPFFLFRQNCSALGWMPRGWRYLTPSNYTIAKRASGELGNCLGFIIFTIRWPYHPASINTTYQYTAVEQGGKNKKIAFIKTRIKFTKIHKKNTYIQREKKLGKKFQCT